MEVDNVISQEIIEEFLNGSDPEQFIVGIEYDYRSNKIFRIIQDPIKGKQIKEDRLSPFLWVGDLSPFNFYGKSKTKQINAMAKYGITITKLETHGNERLEQGLCHLVKTSKTYTDLINFFKQGGIDPWGEDFRTAFQVLTPAEQYLVHKRKRLFKGIDEYSDLHRLVFDIETTGLDPHVDQIILIGIKDTKGNKITIPAFGEDGEKKCILKFFQYIKDTLPSVIGGYNSAFFDFPFILVRAGILDIDIQEMTNLLGVRGIKEREGMLKLANEVEDYTQHILWGFNIIDIAHSVRRAMAINSDIKGWGLKYITQYIEKEKPNRVYVEGNQIAKIYLANEAYYMNPKSGGYKKVGSPGTENLTERYPNKFEMWMGEQIIEQYLDDDLYETMTVDDSFSQSTFLLSKLVPTTYERASTMGTATLWKIIMSAWSYENNLAIPKRAEKRPFTGGLSRLLNVGFSKNIVKFDYSSLYPSIQLVYDIFPECDVMHVQKSLLKYFRDIRIKYKYLASELKDSDPELAESYDRKQLPIKIFINAYFGSLSAPHVFPWGDVDKGEMITCTGRQCLRMMIMYFTERGYKPLILDTDGINFESPEGIDLVSYVGQGNNEMVTKDKHYTGVDAHTAEFNDLFMRNEMGLDIDYFSPACINISRKNYAIKIIKKGKEKIKLTGNSIKSKKMPTYIVEFLDENIKLLLNGDGHTFLENYYNYVEKIFDKKITLSKIANKSRVKMSISDYEKHIQKKTKAGSLMARQAHMELLMHSDHHAGLGDTVYYVNNGKKKSSGDVQKISKPTKKYQAEFLEANGYPIPPNFIEINCYMISEHDIVNEPDMMGDYNVPRYLNTFNKKIEPLLCVFHPSIREDILIEDPEDRAYFTKHQTELVNGFPMKEGGQDNLDEVMSFSESEVRFWEKSDRDPFYMYVEDSINKVDPFWIEHNRTIMRENYGQIKSNEDELITETPEMDINFFEDI